MTKSTKGMLLLSVTSIIWGLAFVAQKLGSAYLGTFTITAIRFYLGFLTLLPLLIKNRDKLKAALKPGILCGTVIGAAAVVQQDGIALAGAGKSGFITSLYMIIVPFLAVLEGKKVTKKHVLLAFVATGGLYLIAAGKQGRFGKGESLVLLSAFLFAVQMIVVDRYSEVDGICLSGIQFITAAVLCSLFIPMERPELSEIVSAALPLLYIGVFSSGIAYTTQILGQQLVGKPEKAVLPLSMESVFSAIFGMIFLSETLTLRQGTGCAIVLVSVIAAQIEKKPS